MVRIIELAKKIKELPAVDRQNVFDFVKYNEQGIALDTLCSQIYEHDIYITKEVYEEIVVLGKKMKMQEESWAFLKDLVK